jgi:hypothetical protein
VSSDNATRSSRAGDLWFGDAKWASAKNQELVVFDRTSFQEMVDDGLPLDKPIIIKEHQHKQDVYGVEAVRKALMDSYGSLEVKMTNTLADAPTLVGMEEFLTRFSDNEWSIGSSTPRDSFGTQHPAFLSYDRFRLLHSAVTRAMCHPLEMGGVGAGCDDVAHGLCVNGGLSFNRVEASGAFSSPCLSPLGGTWLRILKGRRLCAFVSRAKLMASFRDDDFVRNGLEWWPRDGQRLVLLGPNDVLVLPPDVVCAQFAVDAGVSFEGSF